MKEYALYKGDTFIDIGTKKQLCEKWNIAKSTLKNATAPSYWKKMKSETSKRLILVKLDENVD